MTNFSVLTVDDEPFNLDIISDYLAPQGYQTILAENGAVAIEKLKAHPEIGVVLLDRMMPVMDGMEVVKAMKADENWRHIPIIMQTAAGTPDQIREGIEAGVYHYLLKPFEEKILLALVKSAMAEYMQRRTHEDVFAQSRRAMTLVDGGRFVFQTPEDVQCLSILIAQAFPDPDQAAIALHELMMNAVEHGNLGFSYEEKKQAMMEGNFPEKIAERLAQEKYKDRQAHLTITRGKSDLIIEIQDEGIGFDPKPFLDFDPQRLVDPNGRGIALARQCDFAEISYVPPGNLVICKKTL